MSLSAAVIDALVAAGATAEQLAAAMKASLAEQETRLTEKRAKDAARQRKSRMSRAVTVTPCDSQDEKLPPNDIYSNPQNPCEANASQSPLAEKVVSEWNAGAAAKGARKATKLDASRKTLLKARLRDHSEAELFRAMANLAGSRFHCGDNDRGWRAHLGWFLEAKNFLKALEMEGSPAAANDAAPAPREQFEAVCDREIDRHRRAGNEREALSWERKKRGEPDRNGATGPPRSLGALVAGIHQQVTH
jgi:hypothetical protein